MSLQRLISSRSIQCSLLHIYRLSAALFSTVSTGTHLFSQASCSLTNGLQTKSYETLWSRRLT